MTGENKKEQELRVKVAELCGWTRIHPIYPNKEDSALVGENLKKFGPGSAWLPDHPNDLNACAEFEKILSEKDWDENGMSTKARYRQQLGGLAGEDFWRATALQRCEAFVKTKMEGK